MTHDKPVDVHLFAAARAAAGVDLMHCAPGPLGDVLGHLADPLVLLQDHLQLLLPRLDACRAVPVLQVHCDHSDRAVRRRDRRDDGGWR